MCSQIFEIGLQQGVSSNKQNKPSNGAQIELYASRVASVAVSAHLSHYAAWQQPASLDSSDSNAVAGLTTFAFLRFAILALTYLQIW